MSSLITPLQIKQIMDHIPHRYPILLVDRILELIPGQYCKALKNVTIIEPYFQGHYPGEPIMPGVLIVESVAQASSLMLMVMPEYKNFVPLLAAIHNTKFKKQVIPGDQMIIETRLLWFRNQMGRVQGEVKVDGQVVTTCEVSFVVREKGSV